jgi:uridine phosphorylase
MSAEPRHVHPTAPLAPRALLTGDPGRALALAQLLTSEPKMFNHNRGLWGYSGLAEDGEPLTIMSHGMGGPSAAIVLEELCDLGLERAIRIGSCGALNDSLELGELICADDLLGADGTSNALIGDMPLVPDQQMTELLAADADHSGLVVSADLFYERGSERVERWKQSGAIAVEMEAAALLAVAKLRSVRFAALLMVSDASAGAGARLEGVALDRATERLGRTGLSALLASA